MTDTILRALIGAGVGALMALFANIVVLPFVLKFQEQGERRYDHLPKVLRGVAAADHNVKFIYRFMMPMVFIPVFAFVAVKLGEQA